MREVSPAEILSTITIIIYQGPSNFSGESNNFEDLSSFQFLENAMKAGVANLPNFPVRNAHARICHGSLEGFTENFLEEFTEIFWKDSQKIFAVVLPILFVVIVMNY